jgi:hypothetical protein
MGVLVVAECDQCGRQEDIDQEGRMPEGWIKTEPAAEPRFVTFQGDTDPREGLFCGASCVAIKFTQIAAEPECVVVPVEQPGDDEPFPATMGQPE